MKKVFFIGTLFCILPSLAREAEITLTNPASFPRNEEMVEVSESQLKGIIGSEEFVIRDASGKEIPWQATHDGKVIFQYTLAPEETAVLRVSPGNPSPAARKTYGRLFPERLDDMTWENDLMAYRAYGPALQRTGERAFGYDVWTKSVDYPVLEKRYYGNNHGITFHKDHGDGMDVYAVGPTLGGGTTALLDEQGEICYPWCFSDYLILDNGPLRFKVLLNYLPMSGENGVVADETRIITLDAGDPFNHTVVTYGSLPDTSEVVAGQVVHKQNPEGYYIDKENGITAYADLTQNADEGNGVIYVGMLGLDGWMPDYMPMAEPSGDAVGHTVLKRKAAGGVPFEYWWGAGWSKGSVESMEAWKDTLRHKRECLLNPVKVSVSEKK